MHKKTFTQLNHSVLWIWSIYHIDSTLLGCVCICTNSFISHTLLQIIIGRIQCRFQFCRVIFYKIPLGPYLQIIWTNLIFFNHGFDPPLQFILNPLYRRVLSVEMQVPSHCPCCMWETPPVRGIAWGDIGGCRREDGISDNLLPCWVDGNFWLAPTLYGDV